MCMGNTFTLSVACPIIKHQNSSYYQHEKLSFSMYPAQWFRVINELRNRDVQDRPVTKLELDGTFGCF